MRKMKMTPINLLIIVVWFALMSILMLAGTAKADGSNAGKFIHSNSATVVNDGESAVETKEGQLYISEESQFTENESAIVLRNVRFPEKMKHLVLPMLLIKLAYVK